MTSSSSLTSIIKDIIQTTLAPGNGDATANESSKAITATGASAKKILALGTTISVATFYMNGYSLSNIIAKLAGGIYDKMIINMTEIWYRKVLERQNDNAIVLDVGIGTAGALLRCKDIIVAKNLRVIGIDYNEYYVQAAQKNITENNMEEYITVYSLSIYDKDKIRAVLHENVEGEDKKVDSAYFSGSFSLLPDPTEALRVVMKHLKQKNGKVFITQTYQRTSLPFLSHVKPLLKYMTTVDFGKLVKEEEIVEILESVKDDGLVLEEHDVIEGSVDNYWQAAYMSMLGFGDKGCAIKKILSAQPNLQFWKRWSQ